MRLICCMLATSAVLGCRGVEADRDSGSADPARVRRAEVDATNAMHGVSLPIPGHPALVAHYRLCPSPVAPWEDAGFGGATWGEFDLVPGLAASVVLEVEVPVGSRGGHEGPDQAVALPTERVEPLADGVRFRWTLPADAGRMDAAGSCMVRETVRLSSERASETAGSVETPDECWLVRRFEVEGLAAGCAVWVRVGIRDSAGSALPIRVHGALLEASYEDRARGELRVELARDGATEIAVLLPDVVARRARASDGKRRRAAPPSGAARLWIGPLDAYSRPPTRQQHVHPRKRTWGPNFRSTPFGASPIVRSVAAGFPFRDVPDGASSCGSRSHPFASNPSQALLAP